MTAPAVAAAAIAATTTASSKGRRASGSARLTIGMTATASVRRSTPRTPGIEPTRPRSASLDPEATAIVPSSRRIAAAQCSGPWTSSPLRRAIPPRRSLSFWSATEQLPRDVAVAARGEPEVGRGDPLVLGVHERRGLVEVHLALREEAVGDALGEGGAEGARVGEGRQHRRDDTRLGVLLGDPSADRVHQRRVGRRGVADDLLGELDRVAIGAKDLADAAADLVLLHPRRGAAIDGELRARRD